jgi:hypothetical protein
MACYTWKKVVHQLEIFLTLFGQTMLPHIKGGLEDELTVECYEADLDRWTPGPGLPGGNRSQHAAVRVQDRLYVSGGLDHDTVLSTLLGTALVVILLLKRRHFKDIFACRVQPGELHVGGAGGDAGAAS